MSLKTAISGSFKFKPEIDALHEEFADHGVEVLEPTKGWLWTPNSRIIPGEVRPLPAEQGMNSREIEERFLRAIDRSDFLFLNNIERYVGNMSAFELGYTITRGIPIYSREAVNTMQLANYDLELSTFLAGRIVVASVPDIVSIEQSKL